MVARQRHNNNSNWDGARLRRPDDDGRGDGVTALHRVCSLSACTPAKRAVFYALGIPLGELDLSCIDWDVVEAILFVRRRGGCHGDIARPPSRRAAAARSGKKTAFLGERASSSRICMLFHRARQFPNTPIRDSMVPIPILSRRRVIVRP